MASVSTLVPKRWILDVMAECCLVVPTPAVLVSASGSAAADNDGLIRGRGVAIDGKAVWVFLLVCKSFLYRNGSILSSNERGS